MEENENVETNATSNFNNPSPQELPNATVVLVLGICSIVLGCAFVGFILGIVGVVLAKKGREMNKLNPGAYPDYGKLNAGYIMSIIGIVLGVLTLLYYIIVVVIFGGAIMAAAANGAALSQGIQ